MTLSAFQIAARAYSRQPVYVLEFTLGVNTYKFCSKGQEVDQCAPWLVADDLTSTSQFVNLYEFYSETAEQTFKLWDDSAPGSTTGRWLANLFFTFTYYRGKPCKLYMGFKGMTLAQIEANCIFDGVIRDIKVHRDDVEIIANTPQIALANRSIPENVFSANSLILTADWVGTFTSYPPSYPRYLPVNNITEFTAIMAKMHNGAIALKIDSQWFLAVGSSGSSLKLATIVTPPSNYFSCALWGTEDTDHVAGSQIGIGIPFISFTNYNPTTYNNINNFDFPTFLNCEPIDIIKDILKGFGGYSDAQVNANGLATALAASGASSYAHQGHQPPLEAGALVLDMLQDACQAFGVVPVWKNGMFNWIAWQCTPGSSYALEASLILEESLDIEFDDERRITRCSVESASGDSPPGWEWYGPEDALNPHVQQVKRAGPYTGIDSASESSYGQVRNKDLSLFFADDPGPAAHSGQNQLRIQQMWITAFKTNHEIITFDLDHYYADIDILDEVVVDWSCSSENYFNGTTRTYLVVNRVILGDRVRIIAKQW